MSEPLHLVPNFEQQSVIRNKGECSSHKVLMKLLHLIDLMFSFATGRFSSWWVIGFFMQERDWLCTSICHYMDKQTPTPGI